MYRGVFELESNSIFKDVAYSFKLNSGCQKQIRTLELKVTETSMYHSSQ